MSMTDPIADMLTRVRNAVRVRSAEVRMPSGSESTTGAITHQPSSLPVLVWMAHLVLSIVTMLNGFACLQLEASEAPPLLGVLYLAAVVIKELGYLLYWVVQADPKRLQRASVRWKALHHPHMLSPGQQLSAGLLLATWPRGGRPALPFVYSDEVWPGIEYQVASHLIYEGMVDEGLAIVRGLRARHSGERRNPWNEFECGNHYARSFDGNEIGLRCCSPC